MIEINRVKILLDGGKFKGYFIDKQGTKRGEVFELKPHDNISLLSTTGKGWELIIPNLIRPQLQQQYNKPIAAVEFRE